MSREFTLTVVIKGQSLEEVDNELMNAAGERLMARLANRPQVMGQPLTAAPPAPTTEHVASAGGAGGSLVGAVAAPPSPPAPAAHDDGAGKRGVKPGTKRGSYKKEGKPDEQEKSPETEEAPQEAAQDVPASDGKGAQVVPQSAPAHPAGAPASASTAPKAAAQGAVATLEGAIEALKLVNLHHNADKARECLTEFGVQRCGQLTDDNRQAFIDHCKKIAGVA